jgi:hypothetical protein
MPVFPLKKNSRQKLSTVIKYGSYCHINKVCEISCSYGSEYKGGIFLNITPCILVEEDRRFRGAYCQHHQGFIALMMAVRTSETSVYFNETTQSYIPAINLVPSASGEQLVV